MNMSGNEIAAMYLTTWEVGDIMRTGGGVYLTCVKAGRWGPAGAAFEYQQDGKTIPYPTNGSFYIDGRGLWYPTPQEVEKIQNETTFHQFDVLP